MLSFSVFACVAISPVLPLQFIASSARYLIHFHIIHLVLHLLIHFIFLLIDYAVILERALGGGIQIWLEFIEKALESACN